MKITNLASGSKGNSTLIETNNKNILIDIGLPLSALEKRLGRPFPNIDILVVTHTHTDHIKGIKSLVKKYNPTIITIDNNLEEYTNSEKIKREDYKNEEIEIKLFELSHDVPCAGIYLNIEGNEIVYITDTGYIKSKLLKEYQNKNIYIIESNYEEEMLRNGSYPYHLKQRIRSDRGHISNDDTCSYLKKIIGKNTKYIMLAHLSEENNNPEIVDKKIINLLTNIDYNPTRIILNQNEKHEIEV